MKNVDNTIASTTSYLNVLVNTLTSRAFEFALKKYHNFALPSF